MGRFKRQKIKPQREKRFANVKMVLDLINKNKKQIDSLPITTIQIEKRIIDNGDEYNSQTGYEYLIFFDDKSAYLVGETIVSESDGDTGYSEGWEQSHCLDYYQERFNVPALEVLEKIEKVLTL